MMIETPLTEIVKEKNQFFKEVQEKFKNGVKKIFEIVPELQGLHWKQYAPNFDDGDYTEFRTDELYYIFGEEPIELCADETPEDIGMNFYDAEEDKNLSVNSKLLLKAFDEEFNQLTDLLERIFGVDKQITILRNGNISVEDYDGHY